MNEESTPLVVLRGPKKGTPKSPEGDLGDEIQKLLEGKDEEANESLNGGSDEGSFELD